MTNGKDRTESQPTPMSENEAARVVGGQDGDAPGPSRRPCNVPNCSCQYQPPNCNCQGHTHLLAG